ncbi:ATPase family AAA domain-containing protein 2-like [Anneissia japonica]|uniref:ATPase family AAA domain-containing protein 2-like n=1 Tax=Anneissia japonica TaxID=1529436 RepID=UPI001425B138|nr:ATPase family AAA domain-containing protein 2-like [Anneissia japonica]XP_033120278.1 ATPase family AAA domain-containing protein 2-like [Anneissia japonica]
MNKMVKTRDNDVADEEEESTFISLRSSRVSRRSGLQENQDDDESGPEVVMSGSKRRRVNSGYNKVSSETHRSRKFSKSRGVSHDLESEEVFQNSPKFTRRSWQLRSRQLNGGVKGEEDDEDHDDTVQIRRSGRSRRQVYNTMNTKLLGDLMMSGGINLATGPTEKNAENKEDKSEEEEETEGEEVEGEEEDEDANHAADDGSEEDEELESMDMYSRVKRRHILAKKKRDALEKETESSDESSEDSDDSSEDSEEDDDDDEDNEEEVRPLRSNYSLRTKRSVTKRFEVPIEPVHQKKKKKSLFDSVPCSPYRRYRHKAGPSTPVRSPVKRMRRRHATHNRSSTSSDSSSDERRFERRKKKSMAKSRMRCLPMNLLPEDVTGVMKDRQKIGSSLADIDPMTIDASVTFESVGGLGKHVQALKEMVVFPLLYPEVFERFKITPPRGVLFHGPPGTGKTLVARALANECRQGDKRVAFFMRKGADCLSKWVGESERQLRLLFDQAYTMRPSIIFFDEIDGLAPVRSSRQDQIHSSIVSTLLALMDGLDSRGEIVVIGATNRIDSIDPALRRPGRFDREFLFPLPSKEARSQILAIQTKEWNPKLSAMFINEVAEKSVGYCGADVKALCTEAALQALRRQYPQIYASKEKLQLDLTQIQITARDFHHAMQIIVPASQRAVSSPGRSLSAVVRPLLECTLQQLIDLAHRVFPDSLKKRSSLDMKGSSEASSVAMALLNDDEYSDDDAPSIYDNPKSSGRRSTSEMNGPISPFLNFALSAYNTPSTYQPRILVTGHRNLGQSSHLAPALLHHMEHLAVHCLDLPALYAVTAKSPEESCAQVFREARRTCPCVIYMPHVAQWWLACSETMKATFLTLLEDLPSTTPILLLATSEASKEDMPEELSELFTTQFRVRYPIEAERREFFRDLIIHQAARAPPRKKKAASRALIELPVAPPPEPKRINQAELERLEKFEETQLRELRLFLRDVVSRLAKEKKFRVFSQPVDPEEVPDYAAVVKRPMDLATMMSKINMKKYTCASQFLEDIDLICSNALEYNPDRDPSDKIIRFRACELKDTAHAIIDVEMNSDFEKACVDIMDSRKRRGDSPTKHIPDFFRVLPKPKTPVNRLINNTRTHSPASQDTPTMSDVFTDEFEFRSGSVRRKQKRRSTWARGFIAKKKRKLNQNDKKDDTTNDEKEFEEKDNLDEHCKDVTLDEGDTEEDRPHRTRFRNLRRPSILSPTKSLRENKDVSANTNRHNVCENGIAEIEKNNVEISSTLSHSSGAGSPVIEAPVVEPPALQPPVLEHIQTDRVESNKSDRNSPLLQESNEGCTERDELRTEEKTVENNEEEEDIEHVTPISVRMTRSRGASKTAQRALEILEEPLPPLVVDHKKLQELLELTVTLTTNFTVSRLERLHSALSQCIYLHRKDYDKTNLTKAMENVIRKLDT